MSDVGSTSAEPDPFQRRAVVRAANAIMALSSVQARAPVIFIKTLDNLLVGFGEPFGLRVEMPDTEASVFTTVSTQDMDAGPPLFLFGQDMLFQVIRKRSDSPESDRIAVKKATSFLEQVLARILEEEGPEFIRTHHKKLKCGFAEAASASVPAAEVAALPNGVPEDIARRALAGVFQRLESFLTSGSSQFGFPNQANIPRFLVFHRYIASDGKPTVRLNLLESQRKALEGATDKARSDQFLRLSRRVFAFDQWTLEDAFRSGTTGWKRWPWQYSATNPELVSAKRMVAALALGAPSDADFGHALTVPIHVDGLPWLALTGVMLGGPETDRGWAQDFYRDLLPQLTTTVRGLAEQAYLGEIRRLARETLDQNRSGFEALSDTLASLTSTFPYERISLSKAKLDAGQPLRWRGSEGFLQLEQLGFEHSRLQGVHRLKTDDIFSALADAEHDADAALTSHLETRLLSYVNIGHTLKNVVNCTGWALSASEVGRTSHNFDRMVAGRLPNEVHNQVGRALQYADRSLSIIWIVESLGHFIRLAGAKNRVFEWTKFAAWIDRGALVDEAEVRVEAFADGLHQLAVSLSYGCGWMRVRTRVEGAQSIREWDTTPPDPLDFAKLHFPPFKKGSDGGYIFAFCVLEPLVNAIRALNALPGGGDAASSAWLDLTVSTPLDNLGVQIVVNNLSASDLPEKLSGLESTKAIARELGVGVFDTPVSVKTGDGLWRVTTGFHFNAWPVVQSIMGSSGGVQRAGPAKAAASAAHRR